MYIFYYCVIRRLFINFMLCKFVFVELSYREKAAARAQAERELLEIEKKKMRELHMLKKQEKINEIVSKICYVPSPMWT